jgi:hypothetical protein
VDWIRKVGCKSSFRCAIVVISFDSDSIAQNSKIRDSKIRSWEYLGRDGVTTRIDCGVVGNGN